VVGGDKQEVISDIYRVLSVNSTHLQFFEWGTSDYDNTLSHYLEGYFASLAKQGWQNNPIYRPIMKDKGLGFSAGTLTFQDVFGILLLSRTARRFHKELNTINCAFQLAEVLAIQAFPNFGLYNLFCTGTYIRGAFL